ncbi:LysR family transcriptional activator of mexEF-oprN operon [Phyllobacterium ifriqiyense]|uniref:LysR family transcriptional activator of mexEF-oprN operon n=1 Tax=Phyllobacterium ifriqiyense TaxID=314238 RepID=A0ABU0S3T6_9HYPH|nr:LysR family transcriptional regulator [Phyllobacterium ifriqiyense]MDQ0995166.1 LysR family transcriptional activator of mexEF-oprN operon [Phyllobacterium ifriqiyense]
MSNTATIDHFNLWSFDLNLLVAFDALMRDRNVTQAASRLKLQQPAMSHNLATLRLLFQDELFVRVGQVMQPTPRAHTLSVPIQQILSQAHQALISKDEFDPLSETRTFKIGFSSELEVILMPDLVAVLRETAPGIKLLARPANPDQIHRMLDDGIIDLGVGCYDEGGSRHRRRLLFEQSLMCCYNKDLLPLESPLDRATYLRLQHALVSQKDAIEGCLDTALEKLDVRLDVTMAAPEFLTVLSAVTKTPLVATLPTRIIQRYAKIFGLTESPVPLDLEVSPIAMVWSAHSDREPAAKWLRDQIGPLVENFG